MYAGTGAVWENPTRGLPVLNPSNSVIFIFNEQDTRLVVKLGFGEGSRLSWWLFRRMLMLPTSGMKMM